VAVGPGRSLLHYRLVEKLGEGGMGVVWKAMDTTLDREVAVKILPEEVSRDPERLSRFKREAKAVAALNHPNIVTVYSVEEAGGVHFFTMELVEGETLDASLCGGGLKPERLLELAIPVADALAAAHGKGITHRDVKPGNIMVTREGRVKVLDFGLAKLRKEVDTGELSGAATETGTREGAVLGTPPYMSPEQIQGKPLDHRSDIFSLGIVLYEMAAGRRPFPGGTSAEVIASILRDEPGPVDRIRPELSHDLARVIRRCLEKDPERRYQSAKDVRNELEDLARELTAGKLSSEAPAAGAPARAAPGRRLRPIPAAIAAVALLSAALLVWLNRNRLPGLRRTAAAPMFRSLVVLPFDNLMKDPEQEYFVQGIQDALITDLSKIGALRVISRTSAMRYKDTKKQVPEIARELNVDALVEGSVLRAEGRVRITAQLISGRTDQHLWAQSYEGDPGKILGVLNEVAGAIARQIHIVLTPELQRRLAPAPAVSPEVEEAYLKGRFLFSRLDPEDFPKAAELFGHAVELDPGFAAAHAWLGCTEFLMGFVGMVPLDSAGARAEAASRKALELDAENSLAHSILGWVRLTFHWDWKGAEAELRRALELDPNDPIARHGLADYLLVVGDLDGSVRQVELGRQCDPLSQLTLEPVVGHLVYARRYDEAIVEAREILKLHPDYDAVRMFLSDALWQRGSYEESLEERGKMAGSNIVAVMRQGYRARGHRGAMRAAADYLANRASGAPLVVASYYALAGEKDLAFPWLEKAFQARAPQLHYLRADPDFDSLRSDPRFADLLRRIGFPE
jgi:TolB-like protein